MPAEWMPHERCWMAWPCRNEVWGKHLAATKLAYAEVAHAVARFEPVSMVVPPAQMPDARNHLGSDITLVEMEIDDSWTRDSGPCFVSDGTAMKAVCFTFNAWGNKYTPFDRDALMARRIAEHADIPPVFSQLTAEGGSISVDGEGTLLTTESCFPNPNRNPDWTRDEITDELKDRLGVEKVIWLPGNPLEVETDGHVDGIAMFTSPGHVIVETTADGAHPWAQIMQANIEALRGETDARGRPLQLTLIGEAESLELPPQDDERFCRSYVNFYIANGAIIAPSYGIEEDAQACDVLAGCFPDREIVLVPIRDIAIGGGGIHCITQQQPKVG
ncbi:MAG: agmatine deiminase family protein [Rhizobiales bacterium]|nr:agmatine deiminase family protein [Hyphomicrobiales bacterium]